MCPTRILGYCVMLKIKNISTSEEFVVNNCKGVTSDGKVIYRSWFKPDQTAPRHPGSAFFKNVGYGLKDAGEKSLALGKGASLRSYVLLEVKDGWELVDDSKPKAAAAPRKPRAPRATKAQTEPTEPTTTPEPSEPQSEPFTIPTAQPVATAPKTVVDPKISAAQDALSLLFAGAEDRITEKVMAKARPIIDQLAKERGRVVKHEIKNLTTGKTTSVKGIQHHRFGDICQMVNIGLPVYLWGEAGTGKTDLAKAVADALGLPFYHLSKVADVYELTGFVDANGNYVESDLYRAMTNPKGGLLLFDEMDSSDEEALVKFNAVISQRRFSFPGKGLVEANENFRVIGAGNTGGTGANEAYTGRRQLDASTLNRFFYVEIDYDPNIENVCANGDEEILDFIRDLRKVAAKKGVTLILSYRNISAMAQLKAMFKPEEIVRGVIIKEKDKDCVRMLLDGMSVENYWTKALRKCA